MSIRAACLIAVVAAPLAAAAPSLSQPAQATRAQTHYLVGCAGCHGIQGRSETRVVPQLRDRVGYFLCTDEGRGFAVRLPNVAFADANDAELADMMNFVMFGLGGESSRGARPYTAAEVAELRARPLVRDQLLATRKSVIANLPERCRAVAGAYTPDAPAESGGRRPSSIRGD